MAFGLEKLKSLFPTSLKRAGGQQVIGVDIGTSAVKVVQLHTEDGGPVLDTYGELQLGPYAQTDIGKAVELSETHLTEALVDIVRESVATANTAALAISYASSFATNVTIDTADEAEIASRVPIVARKYIPTPLNEVTLDWFVLSSTESPPQTELFLVAIHNDALKTLRGALSGSGLSLAYAELEPFSSARSALSEGNTTGAIIDFGASGARVYHAKEGVIQSTHSIVFGGAAQTETLSKALGISFADAEERKRTAGILKNGGDDAVAKALRPELERAGRELAKIIGTYEQTTKNKVPAAVLVGGGAALPGVVPLMQEILQRDVVRADPFNKVAYPAFLADTLKKIGPSFATSLGSALRQFEMK